MPKKKTTRRAVLRLPDLDHSKSAVLNTLRSPGSRRAYEFALNEFIAWYCSEPRLAFNRVVVVRYRLALEARGLAASSINQRLAAVRRLAYEAADCGLLNAELAAGVRRVKGVKQLGAGSVIGSASTIARSSWALLRAMTYGPSEIMRSSAFTSAAACAAPNWWALRLKTCRSVKDVGPSSISWEREGIFVPFLCPSG